MLLVTVFCSDQECTEEREILVDGLDDVDSQICDCGHGFVVVSVSDADGAPRAGALIELPTRRRKPSSRAA
jgi:hypothetical protein